MMPLTPLPPERLFLNQDCGFGALANRAINGPGSRSVSWRRSRKRRDASAEVGGQSCHLYIVTRLRNMWARRSRYRYRNSFS